MVGGDGTTYGLEFFGEGTHFYCSPPDNGIFLTNLTGSNVFGMARPLGADYNKDIRKGACRRTAPDGTEEDKTLCKAKLRPTLEKIFNKIEGYVNLEDITQREDIRDYEKEIWEDLGGFYLNCPTTDMESISLNNLKLLIGFYKAHQDINFVIHCTCGKGRTGQVVLLLKLYEDEAYDPSVLFDFRRQRRSLRENFSYNSTRELFGYHKPIECNVLLNLLIVRINRINRAIGSKKGIKFLQYPSVQRFGNYQVAVSEDWPANNKIQLWLERKKAEFIECVKCNKMYDTSLPEVGEGYTCC